MPAEFRGSYWRWLLASNPYLTRNGKLWPGGYSYLGTWLGWV